MHQPAVGEVRKPFQRIVVGEADRFAAEVARRHHQDRRARLVAGQPEQQRVQRGVGQHHAQVGVVRSHRHRRPEPTAPRHQHDRSLRTRQQPRGASSSPRCARAVARSGTITANGLSPRRFRRRSSATASSLRGVAGEVVAADALDGEDAAVAQQPPGASQRRLRPRSEPVAVAVAQGRAAVRAAHRLGVEPAVGRVGVFARAVRAHREAGHRGRGAVVGQRGDDREARAAVGAVDERVPVAAVGRVALLGRAVGAHGDIGGGQRAAAV